MSKALIISSSEEFRDSIAAAVKEYGFTQISVSDGIEIRPLFDTETYDLVILNTPLKNESALELADFITQKTDSALIITASQKKCDDVYRRISHTGAYVLPRPFTKNILIQTIRFVITARSKMLDLESERRSLETKLKDIKQINRAKCVLIQYLRISEADAHRQIQKRAMDQRISEVEVARDILKTYET